MEAAWCSTVKFGHAVVKWHFEMLFVTHSINTKCRDAHVDGVISLGVFLFPPPLLSFPCSQSCFLAAFGLNMFLLRAVLTILLSIVVSRAFLTVLFSYYFLTFVCLCSVVCSFSSQKNQKLTARFIHSLIGETFRMSPTIKLTLLSVSPSLAVF